ncbi:MAG: hypothetical protein R2748_19935 [Bryobacterales bacterium]
MKKMDTKEAKIILGAAAVDDVLGLIILAVVSGLVTSIGHGGGGSIDVMSIFIIIGKAAAFLGAAVFAGRLLATVLHIGSKAKVGGMPVVLSVCWKAFLDGGLGGDDRLGRDRRLLRRFYLRLTKRTTRATRSGARVTSKSCCSRSARSTFRCSSC